MAGRLKFETPEENGFVSIPLFVDHLLIQPAHCPNGKETLSENNIPGHTYRLTDLSKMWQS
jgi:hypothetical protein